MDHRQIARSYAVGRIVIGAVLFLFPRRAAQGFVGRSAGEPGVRFLTRALGSRDAIIGLGTIAGMQDGQRLRPWLHYGATADATDALITLLTYRQLPKRKRFLLLALASAGAATGLALAQRVD